MENKTRIKLGDKVSALYGETTVFGIVRSFDYSGYICLDLTQPADLGFRVETESLVIAPHNRGTVKIIEAGPELTAE
jgi:hypothetical protein